MAELEASNELPKRYDEHAGPWQANSSDSRIGGFSMTKRKKYSMGKLLFDSIIESKVMALLMYRFIDQIFSYQFLPERVRVNALQKPVNKAGI